MELERKHCDPIPDSKYLTHLGASLVAIMNTSVLV
jgi:hypothetical protein